MFIILFILLFIYLLLLFFHQIFIQAIALPINIYILVNFHHNKLIIMKPPKLNNIIFIAMIKNV